MRLAVISHASVVGSNRRKLEELSNARDIDLLLVLPARWKNRDIGVVLRADPPKETSHATMIIAAWLNGFGSLFIFSPFRLFTTLQRFRPDVIYVEEEPWGLAALEASIIGRILQKRVVFFTWDNLGTKLPWLQRLIRRLVMRSADAAVAGNKEARRLLLNRRFAKPIAVIPQLGVDPQQSTREISDRLGHRFVVGYVGRLVWQKGIMLLLDAVARIPSAFVMIVGRGPLVPSLVSHANELGIGKRIRFVHGVAHQEVSAYLPTMSALVLPSLTTAEWKEQFGHVLIEAMAAGVPVVGSDSGAIPEVIGDAGIVFKEGDVEGLTAALRRLKDEPNLHDVLRARGLARVRKEFTNKVLARKLHQFLSSI